MSENQQDTAIYTNAEKKFSDLVKTILPELQALIALSNTIYGINLRLGDPLFTKGSYSGFYTWPIAKITVLRGDDGVGTFRIDNFSNQGPYISLTLGKNRIYSASNADVLALNANVLALHILAMIEGRLSAWERSAQAQPATEAQQRFWRRLFGGRPEQQQTATPGAAA